MFRGTPQQSTHTPPRQFCTNHRGEWRQQANNHHNTPSQCLLHYCGRYTRSTVVHKNVRKSTKNAKTAGKKGIRNCDENFSSLHEMPHFCHFMQLSDNHGNHPTHQTPVPTPCRYPMERNTGREQPACYCSLIEYKTLQEMELET